MLGFFSGGTTLSRWFIFTYFVPRCVSSIPLLALYKSSLSAREGLERPTGGLLRSTRGDSGTDCFRLPHQRGDGSGLRRQHRHQGPVRAAPVPRRRMGAGDGHSALLSIEKPLPVRDADPLSGKRYVALFALLLTPLPARLPAPIPGRSRRRIAPEPPAIRACLLLRRKESARGWCITPEHPGHAHSDHRLVCVSARADQMWATPRP